MTSPIILLNEIKHGLYGTMFNYRSGLNFNWLQTKPWGIFWKKVWWDVHVPAAHPIMWQDMASGLIFRPMSTRHIEQGIHRKTDLGSVPPPVQSFFPPAELPPAYVFHDIIYGAGGLWASTQVDGPWFWMPLTRSEADDMCLRSIPEAFDMTMLRRNTIYDAVRIGGWGNYKPRAPFMEDSS
jgi:hypothetical protein